MWGCKFDFLSRWSSRLGSTASVAPWVGTQIRDNCHWISLARWGHLLGSADGQSSCLGSLLRLCCWQEYHLPRSESRWCDPSILPPFFITIWSPEVESFRVQQWSLWDETQVGLLGSTSQCWVSWMFTLDFLSPYRRIHRSSEGRPLSAVLGWPGEKGDAARVEPLL